MTELQQLRARALSEATIAHGATGSRRFIKEMAWHVERQPDQPITLRQAEFLARLCWIYRRQLPKHLVPAQDPGTLNDHHVTEGLDDVGQSCRSAATQDPRLKTQDSAREATLDFGL